MIQIIIMDFLPSPFLLRLYEYMYNNIIILLVATIIVINKRIKLYTENYDAYPVYILSNYSTKKKNLRPGLALKLERINLMKHFSAKTSACCN